MPKDKDLKRHVRARMRRTGESYTAARSHVIGKGRAPRAAARSADLAQTAGMKDDAVRAATGRSWAQWVRALDALDAASLPHREIARRLARDFELPAWWSQMVTVGYERVRGLRERGQRRDGGFDVSKSRTLAVPVATLYRAFGARGRARWLGGYRPTLKKATPRKSMRFLWEDGTPVDVTFWEKGAAKSQVQLQHGRLPTRARAEELRAFWTGRLAALAEALGAG
jgi:hypothetical protein